MQIKYRNSTISGYKSSSTNNRLLMHQRASQLGDASNIKSQKLETQKSTQHFSSLATGWITAITFYQLNYNILKQYITNARLL